MAVTQVSSEDRDVMATDPLPSAHATEVPATVGRFVVSHPIGAGSTGVVVAAHDPVLDRRIALKLLRVSETLAGDARLLHEAQAMAQLAHPNVVAVYEAGAANGRVYLAMEFVEGGTLRAWLAAAPRSWREICDRFVEAGRGLAAAHAAGLVHCDFKPDNVLVGRDGCARVADFGLVRALAAPVDAAGCSAAVAGTPYYLAPEQQLGQRGGPAADQFAFCLALYEALWRTDPFAAPDAAARRARVIGGDIVTPVAGAVPARFAAAVLRGLAADPARRYPTMQALLDDLTRDPAQLRWRNLWFVAIALAGAGVATLINDALVLAPASPPRCTAATGCGDTQGAPMVTTGSPESRRFVFGLGASWAPVWGSSLPRSSWQAFDIANLDQVVAAGATATDLVFDWRAIEPVEGVRDWSYSDHRVAEIEKRGLEPFAQAGGTPDWVGRAEAQCTEPERSLPPWTAAGIAAFQDFFRALAHRYCGRVKYYAFWNEPNGCSSTSCGCGDQTRWRVGLYARWLNEWYQAMRDGCDGVVLAIGGLDCRWGVDPDRPALRCGEYLEQLYAAGAADSFDAVALHPYGYESALRDDQLLNWEAIRRVRSSLERHGHVHRMLWIDEWGFATADEPRKAAQIAAALARLSALPGVTEARYRSVTDLPYARSSFGLVSFGASIESPRRSRRASWFAFRDLALGPGAVWHGPINPGLEYQARTPLQQFTEIPLWGPDGGWAFHDRFPRVGADILGRKFGFYSAGGHERVTQILTDTFEAGRRYCFRSAAQGGRDNVGELPYQIGYVDASGRVIVLRTQAVAVDAAWRETAGVCHEVTPLGSEIGRPIMVGFGSGDDGGASDVWFDNLQVISTPAVTAGAAAQDRRN
jgi:hypothetical protein